MTNFVNHTKIRQRKGQAIVEFMGFICVIVLAMVGFFMRDYIRNAISGRMQQDMGRTFGVEQHDAASTTSLTRSVAHTIILDPFEGDNF